jgi:hypothetical protein
MSKYVLLFALLSLMNAPAQAEGWFETMKSFLGLGADPVEEAPVNTPVPPSPKIEAKAVTAEPAAPTAADAAMETATAVAKDVAMTVGMDSLSGMVAGTLGVTPEQARGGLGTLFEIAKATLGMADFSTLSAAVPEMDSLLAAAPELSEQSKGLSSLMGSAGKYGDALKGSAEAYSRFKSLGLNAEQIPQYIAVTSDFLQGAGGQEATKIWDKSMTSLSGE